MASSKLDDINQKVVCIPFSGTGKSHFITLDVAQAQCSNADQDGQGGEGQDDSFFEDRDLPDGLQLRLSAYQATWSKCLARIQSIAEALRAPVVSAVVQKVGSAYTDVLPGLPYSELPLICVSEPTGESATLAEIAQKLAPLDTDDLFEEAQALAIVAHLQPSMSQNVMTIMKAMINGLINESNFGASIKCKASLSLPNYSIQYLVAWYDAFKEAKDQTIPLVVVLHDFEQFDPLVIQDVFHICSRHIPHLPLIFLAALSSPPSIRFLHNTYSRGTLRLLRVTNITLSHGLPALEEILIKTFFDLDFNPDVLIGPSVLDFLVDHFKRYNSGVDAVVNILQLAHIKHFLDPLTTLISDNLLGVPDLSVARKILDQPTSFAFLESILMRLYGPSDAPAANDANQWQHETVDSLLQLLQHERSAFFTHVECMRIWFNVLIIVRSFLLKEGKISGAPQPKSLLDITSHLLNGELDKDLQYLSKAVQKLGSSQIRDLLAHINDFFVALPTQGQDSVQEARRHCASLIVSMPDDDDATGSVIQIAEGLSDWLQQQWLQSLGAPETSSKLWDVWYTGHTPFPSELLNPSSRAALISGLLQPWCYLQPDDHSSETTNHALWQLSDTSILFWRYLDSGKTLNVYDWFESFVLVLETQKSELRKIEKRQQWELHKVDKSGSPRKKSMSGNGKVRGSPKKKGVVLVETGDDDDEEKWKMEVQARFIRALHELDHLGFIKHTQRKQDHVLRTVFDVAS